MNLKGNCSITKLLLRYKLTIDSISMTYTFFSKTLKAEIVVPPGEVTKF